MGGAPLDHSNSHKSLIAPRPRADDLAIVKSDAAPFGKGRNIDVHDQQLRISRQATRQSKEGPAT